MNQQFEKSAEPWSDRETQTNAILGRDRAGSTEDAEDAEDAEDDEDSKNSKDAEDSREGFFLLPGEEWFEGVVQDSLTMKGLTNVSVVAGRHTITTNSDGTFRFPARPRRLLEITVFRDGFHPLQLRHRPGYRGKQLQLLLKRSSMTLRGRVCNAQTGRPISGAVVEVKDKSSYSDYAGSFALKGLAPTFHQIRARARGYMEAIEIFYVDGSGEPKDITLFPLR